MVWKQFFHRPYLHTHTHPSLKPIGSPLKGTLLFVQIRCELFQHLQDGKADVLVCTDIASRGLDTSDVSTLKSFFRRCTALRFI